ncbi:hypothetical protein B0H16DRAFT_1768729 [Mycena metata]|uniref:Uncharacterized protein n=1 Tax=Mycena metata TaxID=1033252 RepID=A0AAD7JWX7_9AGAR|nr:hypothetical protein B0H16DRAFT_1768729 [Mycena metata]
MSTHFSTSLAAGPSLTFQPSIKCCAPTDTMSSAPLRANPGDSSTAPLNSTRPVLNLTIPTQASLSSTQMKAQDASTHNKAQDAIFSSSSPSSHRRNRDVSVQAIYEGLPPSPSDTFFTPQTIGLGLVVRSPSTNKLVFISPLDLRRPSPTHGVPFHHLPSDRILLSSTLMVRATGGVTIPPAQLNPKRQSPASRYAGLGHGLPSHMRGSALAQSLSNRFASGLTITSLRSISALFDIIPSGSHSRALLNAMPALARCPRSGVLDAMPQRSSKASVWKRVCATVVRVLDLDPGRKAGRDI